MALPEGLPEYTIGWQVLDWCSANLTQPDGDNKGDPWEFMYDQAHFILWFYAVDAEGEWLYRRAYRERAKGTGKTPMVSAIACAELLGPAQFSHFDANGKAVGKPRTDPVIWLAAISLLGTNHTYDYITGMLEGDVQYKYDLDVGATRIKRRDGSKGSIRQVTASPKSLEGPRPTFVICEETQHWTPNDGGHKLVAAIHRGLGKTNGRRIEVTNAPVPGERSVAELTHEFWADVCNGDDKAEGLLFDTFSIHVDDIYDHDQAMPALLEMYKNAPWQNLKRLWRDINDLSSHSELDSRRFFFNETVAPDEMWIKAEEWDAAASGSRLSKKHKIALGFRYTKEAAAVIATRLQDNHVFVLKIWERPTSSDVPRSWEVPVPEIDSFVRRCIDMYKVVYVMTSPNGFKDVIGRWEESYPEVVFEAIWLDKNKTKHSMAEETFRSALRGLRVKHDGNLDLRRHVLNTFTSETPQGTVIRPETRHSRRYIVAAEAAMLSVLGAVEAIADGLLAEGADTELVSFS